MSVDQDMLISYALGHLTPRAEAEVVTHLASHPEDAALVSDYLGSLADFALQLAPETLPETGEADLLARIRGEVALEVPEPSLATPPEMPLETPSVTTPETPAAPAQTPDAPSQTPPPPVIIVPSPPRRTVWWLAGLAAAAALLYFGVLPFVGPEVTYTQLEQYQAEPGAVSYALTQEGQAEPLGTLVRLQNGRVFVSLAAPPTENQVYQAWNIGDAAVSLGTFSERSFLSQAEVPLGNTFGLSLEPPGGSDQPTTTPLTLIEL